MWADTEFKEQTAYELDRTWYRIQIEWIELSPFRTQIKSAHPSLDKPLTRFTATLRGVCDETENSGHINPNSALELLGCWEKVKKAFRRVDGVQGEKDKFGFFACSLDDLAKQAALHHCLLEYPISLAGKQRKTRGRRSAARRS